MVVTAAVTTGRHGRKGSSLFCATVLLAGIAIAPTPTQSAGSSSVGSPSSPFTLRRKPLRFDLVGPSRFDSHFFSLSSSYGPMSVIAPTVYGDFRSPSYQAWSPSTGSGVQPMSETEGGDPAVTTMFDTLKVGLLPGAGSAGAVMEVAMTSAVSNGLSNSMLRRPFQPLAAQEGCQQLAAQEGSQTLAELGVFSRSAATTSWRGG